jgi:uncharacterized protein with PIN domain
MDARLKEIWPDGGKPAPMHIGGFDDVEAYATQVGDAATCQIMEDLLQYALNLPIEHRPERCEKCGRKLQYSRKSRTISGIRGPVTFEREYAYCRKCRSGFFPC